ncbi:Pol [Symbiodinium sp. CCMP2456]|nr:Pol [Symbiodinium sp. CCMP2456]
MSILRGPPGVPGDFYPPIEKADALHAAVLLVLLPGSLGVTLATGLRFCSGQDASNRRDFGRLLCAYGALLAGATLQPVLWAMILYLPTPWTNSLAVALQAANVTFVVLVPPYFFYVFLQVCLVRGNPAEPSFLRVPRALGALSAALLLLFVTLAALCGAAPGLTWSVLCSGDLDFLLEQLRRHTGATETELCARHFANQSILECENISRSDVVTEETGPACFAWCRVADCFLPMFPFLPGYCLKAEIWQAVQVGGPGWLLPSLVAFAYGCIGWYRLLTAWQGFLGAKNGYKAASGSDGKRQLADWEEVACSGPTATGFCPDGPYHAPDFPDLLEMLCKSLSQNDLQAERWSMKLALAVASLDPAMDIYSALSLYAKGQPYYGSALLLAALLPNLADIFQTQHGEEMINSLRRGFATMDLLKHQAREGYWEGTVSALVAICALMYTPTLTSLDLFSLSFNVLSSVVLSIPNGLKAESLLELGEEAGYYERVRRKRGMDAYEKWGRSLQVLIFGPLVAACVALRGQLFPPSDEAEHGLCFLAACALLFCLFAEGAGPLFTDGLKLVSCLSALCFWTLFWQEFEGEAVAKLRLLTGCLLANAATVAFGALCFRHRRRTFEEEDEMDESAEFSPSDSGTE